MPHDRPNCPDDPECPYTVGSPLEAIDPAPSHPAKSDRRRRGPRALQTLSPSAPELRQRRPATQATERAYR
ncbi:hypothetical protein [Streptomyces sp. NBC_01003]|uniref:hypothetical protein n=1 Tax=Streptomyces sp. NBC_01003 TaxID=2903714 RepID=UPI0038637A03